MEASFRVGNENKNNFRVVYGLFGSEKYFLNNELLQKCWGLSLLSKRIFNIEGETIEIVVSATPSDFYSKVYRNGELYIEELFPDFKAKIEKKKSKRGKSIFMKHCAIWFGITVLAIILLKIISKI